MQCSLEHVFVTLSQGEKGRERERGDRPVKYLRNDERETTQYVRRRGTAGPGEGKERALCVCLYVCVYVCHTAGAIGDSTPIQYVVNEPERVREHIERGTAAHAVRWCELRWL